MSWVLVDDGGQAFTAPDGADVSAWAWTLKSPDGTEERRVEVWISRSAMTADGVSLFVRRARESDGLTAVLRVMDWDEPPVRIKLFTGSGKPVFEGGDPGPEVRELNEIAEWFDKKGIALVFTGRGIGTGPGPVAITTHSANLIDLEADDLVGRAEAPTRLEAARKAKEQWLAKHEPSGTTQPSAPSLRVDTARVDRLRQQGIHLIWSYPDPNDADSGWLLEAWTDEGDLRDIAVADDPTDALLTVMENLLPEADQSE